MHEVWGDIHNVELSLFISVQIKKKKNQQPTLVWPRGVKMNSEGEKLF